MIRRSVNAYSAYQRRQPNRKPKAPKPGSQAWQNAWQNAWTNANPGQQLPGSSPPQPTPAPQAPPAPLGGLQPDSLYEQALSNINAGLNTSQLLDTHDLNAAGLQAGVAFDTNEQGQASNFRVDYSDPFSRASLLKRAFEQNTRGNTNSMASRGQLYSGALQRAQNTATTGFQQGQHELLSGFGNLASEIFRRRMEAQQAAKQAELEAAAMLAERHVDAGPQPGGSAPGMSGAEQLAALGGTLVLRNGKRYVRRPDGSLQEI